MERVFLLLLLSVAFAFGFFCPEGYAQMRETGKPALQCEKNFDAMDTNHDGIVTKEEFLAFEHKGMRNPEEVFRERDTNEEGRLTKDQFCAGKGRGWGWGRGIN